MGIEKKRNPGEALQRELKGGRKIETIRLSLVDLFLGNRPRIR
jgi:hypothetical protein